MPVLNANQRAFKPYEITEITVCIFVAGDCLYLHSYHGSENAAEN